MPRQHALRLGHDLRHHLYGEQHDWLPLGLQVHGRWNELCSRHDAMWRFGMSDCEWWRRVLH
jgi:hypothetical protein